MPKNAIRDRDNRSRMASRMMVQGAFLTYRLATLAATRIGSHTGAKGGA